MKRKKNDVASQVRSDVTLLEENKQLNIPGNDLKILWKQIKSMQLGGTKASLKNVILMTPQR